MLLCTSSANAQLSLSTLTDDVQCYGDLVTLACIHPELPQFPEYLQPDIDLRRDGRGISTDGLGKTKLSTNTTILNFTITQETVGNYTCFLVDAVRGGIVESNIVTVRPLGECNNIIH